MPRALAPAGTLWAEHVSGEMTSGEREVRLNRLRAVAVGERGVLTNARCLTEGVDVPTLDGVAFIDPRRSQVDVVQAVGRAMRKADDKTVGTIVIPVFVDEDADPEQALDASEFDRVWQVVQGAPRPRRGARRGTRRVASRTGSARIARTKRRRRSCSNYRPGSASTSPAPSTPASSKRQPEDGSSGTDCLRRFVAREGHARVPLTHVEDDHNLGTWVSNQRRRYSTGSLSSERAERLHSLPGWVWSERGTQWDEGFSVLERFVAREGHDNGPVGPR